MKPVRKVFLLTVGQEAALEKHLDGRDLSGYVRKLIARDIGSKWPNDMNRPGPKEQS